MFNRIGVIAALTGLGQLLSIFSLKLAASSLSNEKLASIAQVDTVVLFITFVLAAGLQSAAMRDIATLENWHLNFAKVQSARICLAILLLGLGCFFPVKWGYLVFFISPIIALNADYALYALGKSIKAAFTAFLRLLIPYSALIASIFFARTLVTEIFMCAWLISYLVTNTIIFSNLRIKINLKLSFRDLKLYLDNLPLGIAIIASNFLGIGLVLIIPYFYSDTIEATAFIALKFYTIFKGVLRIIHQAFLKEMSRDEICLKVDQLSILAALLYVFSFLAFPTSVISIFFGNQYVGNNIFFTVLALAGVIYSFLQSVSTKALFEKKDTFYSIIVCIASLAAILVLIILGLFRNVVLNIAVAVIIGELIMASGLAYISSNKNLFLPRTKSLLKNLPVFIIPVICRVCFGDVLTWYIIGFGVTGFILVLINYKDFKTI